MKKKLISLALSAVMLFAGFSISAFAEEPLTGSEPEPAAAEAVEEEENSLFRKPPQNRHLRPPRATKRRNPKRKSSPCMSHWATASAPVSA